MKVFAQELHNLHADIAVLAEEVHQFLTFDIGSSDRIRGSSRHLVFPAGDALT